MVVKDSVVILSQINKCKFFVFAVKVMMKEKRLKSGNGTHSLFNHTFLQRLIFNIKNVNYLMSVADVSLPCHHLDVVNNNTM